MYEWDSGFGSKYADPSTGIPGGGQHVGFSPDGNYFAVGHGNSPFVAVYPWSSDGFGTKYANPSPSLSSTCRAAAWNPNNDVIVVDLAPAAYSCICLVVLWFGSKYSDPSTTLLIQVKIAFNSDGQSGCCSTSKQPLCHCISLVKWFGTSIPTLQLCRPQQVTAYRFILMVMFLL